MSRVWSGQASLDKRLKAITSPRAKKLLGGALKEAGDLIGTYAQKLITTGSVSGKEHVVSAPGEPPQNDSGVLANNIEVSPPIISGGEIDVTITSNAPYATALEMGTSRMEARPYFRPARDAKKREARARFAEQVDKIVKGAAD
jgi:HK97 gp10 family phage protein